LNGSVMSRPTDRRMQCYCQVSDSGFVRRVDEAAKRDMCGLRCATCTSPHCSVPIELRAPLSVRKKLGRQSIRLVVFSEAWSSYHSACRHIGKYTRYSSVPKCITCAMPEEHLPLPHNSGLIYPVWSADRKHRPVSGEKWIRCCHSVVAIAAHHQVRLEAVQIEHLPALHPRSLVTYRPIRRKETIVSPTRYLGSGEVVKHVGPMSCVHYPGPGCTSDTFLV
jgi:hypothetical protein